MWLTYKELMAFYDISRRTAVRRKDSGEWPTRKIKNPKGGKAIAFFFIAEADQRAIFEDNGVDRSQIQCATSEDLVIENVKKFVSEDGKKEEMADPALPKSENQCAKIDKSLKNIEDSIMPQRATNVPNENQRATNVPNENQRATNVPNENQRATNVPNENHCASGFSEEKNHPVLEIPSHPSTEGNCKMPIYSVKKSLPSELDPLRWIPLDRAVALSGLSERTIYRRIESGELYSITVPDKLSKQRALIEVSGFSNEVVARWRAEVLANNNDLASILHQEKKKFELHCKDDKDVAWARKSIIEEYYNYRKLAKASGTSLTRACKQFEIKVNSNELLPGILKRLGAVSVSIKTIKKWEKTWRDSGNNTYPVSLLDNKKGKVGRKSLVSSKLEKEIEYYATSYKDFPASEIYRVLSESAALMGEELPISVRTLTNLVNKIRSDKAKLALMKGKKWEKDNLRPHVKRINNALPGEIVESDGHKLNNLVYSPFYAHKSEFKYLVRPQLMVWYDVGTGFILDGTLTLSENRNVVRTSLRYAILKGGLPDEIRLDNGPAYKNADFVPLAYAGKKRLTPAVKRAKEMLSKGDKGLYANLGISCRFTIPGNPESKSIEPFWGFCVSMFEKIFPVWIGNNIQNRPDILKLTNAVLMKRYGKYIPTWEQYDELLQRFIQVWNNRKRGCLVNGRGETLSPQEAYSQVEHKTLPLEELERITKFAYPNPYMVSRGRINVNGILYWHPSFRALEGKNVNAYYDEKNIKEVTIGTEYGEIFQQAAMIVYPGLQVGDDMGAYIEARHQEKVMMSVYAAINEAGGNVARNRIMLESTSDTVFIQDKKQDKIKQGDKMLLPSANNNSQHAIKLIPEDEITITEDDIAKSKQASEEADKLSTVRQEEAEEDKIKSIMQKIKENQEEEIEEDDEIESILREMGVS